MTFQVIKIKPFFKCVHEKMCGLFGFTPQLLLTHNYYCHQTREGSFL